MATFEQVASLLELDELDSDEIVAGYRDWRSGDPEPGPNRGKAYWLGWTNAAYDHRHADAPGVAWAVTCEYAARLRSAN
jgi:hypothetical protein